MLPSFELFGKEISMYALMSIIGLLVAGFVFCRRIARAGQDDNEALLFLLVLGVGMLIGGHLLFALTNLRFFPLLAQARTWSQTLSVLGALFGGMVFYGGLIGAYVLGLCYVRWRKLDKVLYMDSAALFAPLFHGFARVGCFFGGCCFGIESPFGFCAVGNTLTDIGEVRRFPVQLLEAVMNLAIAALILWILKKGFLRGHVFYLYLLLYAFVRFFDEFLRGDAIRGFIFGMSTSQFISIPVALFAGGMLLTYARRRRAARPSVLP